METNQQMVPRGTADGSRRDFMKLCSAVASALGLGAAGIPRVAEALSGGNKPTVLWLHFSECTGCTEAFLRTMNPWADDIIFDTLSIDYHETLMAGAGQTVHDMLLQKAEDLKGDFFAVVEGAIPTADNGIYGTVSGKTMLSIAEEILPKAKAILAIGGCASYGGIAAAAPNPTGAKGVTDALPNLAVPVVNIPGCPPNPITFVSAITDYLLNGSLPSRDAKGRPLFAYGKTVHEDCPFKQQFEAGGDDPCVYYKGCKGPGTYNNCTTVWFNDGTSFPMQAGHPCIGCSEPGFWDILNPAYPIGPNHDPEFLYDPISKPKAEVNVAYGRTETTVRWTTKEGVGYNIFWAETETGPFQKLNYSTIYHPQNSFVDSMNSSGVYKVMAARP